MNVDGNWYFIILSVSVHRVLFYTQKRRVPSAVYPFAFAGNYFITYGVRTRSESGVPPVFPSRANLIWYLVAGWVCRRGREVNARFENFRKLDQLAARTRNFLTVSGVKRRFSTKILIRMLKTPIGRAPENQQEFRNQKAPLPHEILTVDKVKRSSHKCTRKMCGRIRSIKKTIQYVLQI